MGLDKKADKADTTSREVIEERLQIFGERIKNCEAVNEERRNSLFGKLDETHRALDVRQCLIPLPGTSHITTEGSSSSRSGAYQQVPVPSQADSAATFSNTDGKPNTIVLGADNIPDILQGKATPQMPQNGGQVTRQSSVTSATTYGTAYGTAASARELAATPSPPGPEGYVTFSSAIGGNVVTSRKFPGATPPLHEQHRVMRSNSTPSLSGAGGKAPFQPVSPVPGTSTGLGMMSPKLVGHGGKGSPQSPLFNFFPQNGSGAFPPSMMHHRRGSGGGKF